MNNEQFRRLIAANSTKSDDKSHGSSPATSQSPASPGGLALGSRQRSSIPMTPRSVGGGRHEFARQLAARDNANRSQKQFKTSAPKGSRLAEGYVDRARTRDGEEEDDDDRAGRIAALEELLKKGDIDQETFDKQRAQIAGGDLSSTHLVKGLDFKLLERVRRGEDVFGDGAGDKESPEPAASEEDVEDAFSRLEEQEVQAVAKERAEKKGQRADISLVPGKKRTRDQIIAEMKAARAAQKAQQESALGNRFKKVGAKQKAGTRIERDGKGREVMVIVDEDGHEKRKVRKVQPGGDDHSRQQQQQQQRADHMVPDAAAVPLGMEVPEYYRKQQEAAKEAEEEEDDDIFADAGDDYDPLAGMDSDSSSDEGQGEGEGEGERQEEKERKKEAGGGETPGEDRTSPEDLEDKKAMPPPPPPPPQGTSEPSAETRDYFKGSKTELLSSKVNKAPSMSDPALQAAFKKAAQLSATRAERGGDGDVDGEEAKKRAERHKRMLESAKRDDEDLDLGFGTSRFEDEEDVDETKIKLSEWGEDDDGQDEQSRGGKGKRKRGPKKRKGDANSAADVMRIVEQRKGK